jgi:hypothetical protein
VAAQVIAETELVRSLHRHNRIEQACATVCGGLGSETPPGPPTHLFQHPVAYI